MLRLLTIAKRAIVHTIWYAVMATDLEQFGGRRKTLLISKLNFIYEQLETPLRRFRLAGDNIRTPRHRYHPPNPLLSTPLAFL